ncbi:MAG: CerR family C-terminal domain-containing protein [Planctomycetes bacterium]|nr:CerR family C-terminal domain-containing protein [Planctomycetota bacterium]
MTEADDTKRKLLEAAGAMFARDGFRAATVRGICSEAGANVAAVKYHFGDKLGLYRAVFRHAFTFAPPPRAPRTGAPVAERLRDWVADFLGSILDLGRPAWHARLMAREMTDPSEVLDEMVATHIRPRFAEMAAIVGELLPGGPPAAIRRAASSVVAQCVFYHHARPVITRLHPAWKFTADEVAAIAEHVAVFSLAGLRASAAAIRSAR